MVVRVGANSAGWRRLLLADCLSSGLFVQLIQCEYVRAHVLPACLYLQYLSSVVSLHEEGALLDEFTLLRVCVLYLMWFGCSEVGLFENFPTAGCQAKEWSGERQPLLLVKHRGCNCVFACRWVCKVKKEKKNAKGEHDLEYLNIAVLRSRAFSILTFNTKACTHIKTLHPRNHTS